MAGLADAGYPGAALRLARLVNAVHGDAGGAGDGRDRRPARARPAAGAGDRGGRRRPRPRLRVRRRLRLQRRPRAGRRGRPAGGGARRPPGRRHGAPAGAGRRCSPPWPRWPGRRRCRRWSPRPSSSRPAAGAAATRSCRCATARSRRDGSTSATSTSTATSPAATTCSGCCSDRSARSTGGALVDPGFWSAMAADAWGPFAPLPGSLELLLAVAAVGCIAWQLRRPTVAWLVLAGYALVLLVAVARFYAEGGGAHGRYLYPLLRRGRAGRRDRRGPASGSARRSRVVLAVAVRRPPPARRAGALRAGAAARLGAHRGRGARPRRRAGSTPRCWYCSPPRWRRAPRSRCASCSSARRRRDVRCRDGPPLAASHLHDPPRDRRGMGRPVPPAHPAAPGAVRVLRRRQLPERRPHPLLLDHVPRLPRRLGGRGADVLRVAGAECAAVHDVGLHHRARRHDGDADAATP